MDLTEKSGNSNDNTMENNMEKNMDNSGETGEQKENRGKEG